MLPRPPGEIQTSRPYSLPGLYAGGTYMLNDAGCVAAGSTGSLAAASGAGGLRGAGGGPPGLGSGGRVDSDLRACIHSPVRVGGTTPTPPRCTTRATIFF